MLFLYPFESKWKLELFLIEFIISFSFFFYVFLYDE